MTIAGMPPSPTGAPFSDDTVEKFVLDLRALFREHPDRLTLQQLADRALVSKSTCGAATKNTSALPSEDTVKGMLQVLDPTNLLAWLKRRNQLARTIAARPRAAITPDSAAGSTADSPADFEADAPAQSPPTPVFAVQDSDVARLDSRESTPPPTAASPAASDETRPRRGRLRRGLWVAAIAVAGLAGAVATTPFELGGVNAVKFCGGNYPRTDGRSGQIALTGSWDSWRCELDDAEHTSVPIDFQLACRQQYPPIGPFGGAQYAAHVDLGHASWRCYGSLLHR